MPLPLPDSILLSKIKKASAYYDKKSIEEFTNRVRYKYKLAGNSLLNTFYFFVLFTEKSACNRRLLICLAKSDWEYKKEGYLDNEFSYTDLNKCEALDEQDILGKMRDLENGFEYVAKLKRTKFEQFRKIYARSIRNPYIRLRDVETITNALNESLEEPLIKLGIN
jgi:hypothetical protein